MRLSVMQPYFFPYLGYFSLIAATDRFVVFDPVQYIRRGWINRNRMLKADFQQTQFINVPIAKHRRDTAIRDVRIATDHNWQAKIVAQLQHYKKRAPFFRDAMTLVEGALEFSTDSMVELNVHCLRATCQLLEMDLHITHYDELPPPTTPASHPGEWALQVSITLGADGYINPVGGKEIFDASQFLAQGVELQFIHNRLTPYSQRNGLFVPGLSILDVLMFNGIENTRKLVEDYQLTTGGS